MSTSLQKNLRNQSLDLCKLIAAVLVVLIHEPFPGTVGKAVTLLARFAVPMFLAITGYFSWNITSKTIARRLKYILCLIFVSSLFYFLFTVSLSIYTGASLTDAFFHGLPPLRELIEWIILQKNPFAGHLWYLSAVALCYGMLWVYVRFYGEKKVNHRGFYLLGLFFGALLLMCDVILPWTNGGVYFLAYRNGWLTGIPMFTLGMFLHEYQDTLRKKLRLNDAVLIGAILLGMAVAVWERLSGIVEEIPLGHLILTPSLLLLLVFHPQLPTKSAIIRRLIGWCGPLSTWIYILHIAVMDLYTTFLLSPAQSLLGPLEPWLRPIGITLLTIPAAIAASSAEAAIRKGLKKSR